MQLQQRPLRHSEALSLPRPVNFPRTVSLIYASSVLSPGLGIHQKFLFRPIVNISLIFSKCILDMEVPVTLQVVTVDSTVHALWVRPFPHEGHSLAGKTNNQTPVLAVCPQLCSALVEVTTFILHLC